MKRRALLAGLIALCVLILGGCGEEQRAQVPETSSPAPPPPRPRGTVEQFEPSWTRAVHITSPADGTSLLGRPVGDIGQRIAKLRVTGTADPDAQVFVSGNGDGGRHDDWVTVQSDGRGRWRTRVNVIGCGDAQPAITAGYDEPNAEEAIVGLHFDCGGQETVPRGGEPPPAAPHGSCDETPARNFPVPPGDARDADGDGIGCET